MDMFVFNLTPEKRHRFVFMLAATIYLLSVIATFVAGGFVLAFALSGNTDGLRSVFTFLPINTLVLLVSNSESRRRLKKVKEFSAKKEDA